MCKDHVFVVYTEEGKPVTVRCGSTTPYGDVQLCNACQEMYEKRYPQGWRYVPGDICKHGCYVGDASGPDYMCGYCESGTEPAPEPIRMTQAQKEQYVTKLHKHIESGGGIWIAAVVRVLNRHRFNVEMIEAIFIGLKGVPLEKSH